METVTKAPEANTGLRGGERVVKLTQEQRDYIFVLAQAEHKKLALLAGTPGLPAEYVKNYQKQMAVLAAISEAI